MDLKPVAMFRELYKGERDELPSIRDAVVSDVEPDRSRIVEYMRSAERGLSVMEAVPDLFDSGAYIPGGPSLHTDGVWVWRTDSLRYVRRERIALPAEFVEFVRARDYTLVPVEDTDDLFDAVRAWW